MRNLYGAENPGKAVMNMFVCAPRSLIPRSQDKEREEGCFEVEILERHPFTTQTFIPLGLSGKEGERTSYLVIVAPSLEPSGEDEGLPVPTSTSEFGRYPGRGLPDLKGVQAFLANGSQAVTYGAGTWYDLKISRFPYCMRKEGRANSHFHRHAPMVVIGEKPIDFVVVQFANGVAIEDCQEVKFKKENGGGLLVTIPGPKAKL